MVLIRDLSEEYSLTSSLLENAKIRSMLKSDRQFKVYMAKVYLRLTNSTLTSLRSVNGLPLDAFLLRLSCVSQYNHINDNSTAMIIEQIIDILTDYPDENGRRTFEETKTNKMITLKKLCELAATKSRSNEMIDWLKDNALSLNRALIHCIDDLQLASDACYTIAYLARKFHFDMLPGIDIVIAGLVRTLAIIMIPTENKIRTYRAAADQHLDMELCKARALIFHRPPYRYTFDGTHHYLIAVIYFTLADIVSSIPSPRLINFFHCRIFRRKEMTRRLLFQIFEAVVLNLDDLEASALKMSSTHEKDANGKEISPLSTYEATAWPLLPAQLYADLLRVYHDHNALNKELIVGIMQMLKAHTKIKLPIFEDEAIKTMQLYTNIETKNRKRSIRDKKKSTIVKSLTLHKAAQIQQTDTKISYDEDERDTMDQTDLDALELSSYMSEDMGSRELTRPSIVPTHLPNILDLASMLRRQKY